MSGRSFERCVGDLPGKDDTLMWMPVDHRLTHRFVPSCVNDPGAGASNKQELAIAGVIGNTFGAFAIKC
jgi:hypothetical protein